MHGCGNEDDVPVHPEVVVHHDVSHALNTLPGNARVGQLRRFRLVSICQSERGGRCPPYASDQMRAPCRVGIAHRFFGTTASVVGGAHRTRATKCGHHVGWALPTVSRMLARRFRPLRSHHSIPAVAQWKSGGCWVAPPHVQHQSASYQRSATHFGKLDAGHAWGQRAKPCLTGL